MTDCFEVGDIVSRDGSDEQRILDIDYDWGIMTVECVKEPTSKWILKGEKESNLIRKYNLVRKAGERS